MTFGTQTVKILLYRNFDGSKLARPHFDRHLGFQNSPHFRRQNHQILTFNVGPRTERVKYLL